MSDGDSHPRTVSVGCKLIDVRIVRSLGHATEVQGTIVGNRDFESGKRRDFVGFHRANDFRSHQDEKFRFILR